MANTTETATFNVDSNIGEVGKDAKEAAAEFKIMGVSLNGVKKGFASAALTAKGMFGSIKAGLISTGIGAFVVLIGSLLTFFTKTKKGAELLEVAFAGIGAAISVITDRVSKFGGAIVKLFKGDVKGALTDVKGAFTGIGTEIANDTNQAIALKQAFISLRDSERDLNVETAQRRAEIEALKLIAEDVSKSESERLAAAKEAFKIENDLLDKRVSNAEEALRLQQQEMSLSENMQEDLDKEAELLINLANIRAESTTKQIELNNKINAIEAQVAADRETRNQDRLDNIAEEKKARQDLYDMQIAQADALFLEFERIAQKEIDDAKTVADTKQKIRISELNNVSKGIGLVKSLAGENRKLQGAAIVAENAVGIAKTIINTNAANSAAILKYAALPGGQALSAAEITSNKISAAISIASSIAATSQGLSALGQGGGAGGGGSIASGGGTDAQTPAPQMMSGAFELSGGVAPDPVQAFVVTDEMTNSQNQLANIRRRATI